MMNKNILKYAILIYTFFSGLIATAFAIAYFVTGISMIAPELAILLEGTNTLAQIVSVNLTPTQQSYYINMLESYYEIGITTEQQSLANLSFNQFIGYELIFILPPAILIGLAYYIDKKENHDD